MVSVNGVFSQPSKDYSSNGASEATTGIKEASLVPKPYNDFVGKSQISNIIDIHTMSCTLYFLKENTTASYTESEIIQREDVSSSNGGSAVSDSDFGKLSSVLNAQVGKPYVWGAEGPDSFDCSGLVCYAFNQSGIKSVGRTTAQGYYNMCTKVSVSNRQPGDLVFWADNGKVYHVGIYIGDGIQKFCPTCKTRPTGDPNSFGFRMINAENENVDVRKTKLWSNVYAYGRL